MTGADITVESTAREMALAVREREISARELLDLHLDRIETRNGEISAVVYLDPKRAQLRQRARLGRLSAVGVESDD